MKKKPYFIFLFIGLCWLNCFEIKAQENGATPAYNGVIKYRPVQFGEYYVSWENVKETDQTNEIGLGYIHKSFVAATDKDRNTLSGFYDIFLDGEEYAISEANGIVLRMSQRNYTTKTREAPEGFYYGPAITYRFIAFDPDLLRATPGEVIGRMYQNVLAFHYQVGYQAIIAKHLSLEVFGGLGIRGKLAKAKISNGRTEDKVIGPVKVTFDDNSTVVAAPALHLNFSLGYAF
jgi:hypothetical protein